MVAHIKAGAVVVIILALCATQATADDQSQVAKSLAEKLRDRDGQYFCVVDHTAGLRWGDKEKNKPFFSGKVTLPPEDTKFIIVRRARPPEQFMREYCKKSVEFWLDEKRFQSAAPDNKDLLSRRLIGTHCFSTEQILWKSGQQSWEYRGYDGFEYFGVTVGSWFKFYNEGSFEMGFDYDEGPVIEAGHCTRIEPAK